MSIFDERERSYERKFQQDQELAFKVKARRNRLLGLWAAERLGLAGDAAEAYARDVVAADLGKAGAAAIVAQVADDFAKRGIALDAARVRVELERCAAEAKKQLGPGS